MTFEVKDSGKREEYPSGMRRDTQEGKPDYTLIDPVGLERVAIHLVKGAEKYGRDNWRKANSEDELTRFKSSAFRHFMQWLRGDVDEDHMAAVVFNLFAAEYVKRELELPTGRPNLTDGNLYTIQIVKSSSRAYWYSKHIGQVFLAIWSSADNMFFIKKGGPANLGAYIHLQDCRVDS